MSDKLKYELKKDGLDEEHTLELGKKFIDPRTGIITRFGRAPYLNDEPKFFRFFAYFSHTSLFSDVENKENIAGGSSIEIKRAQIKTLGEAIERYCLSIYRKKDLLLKSYKDIKDNALDPKTVTTISKTQLPNKEFKIFNFNDSSMFKWIGGFCISTMEPVLIPAQLVYVPYKYENEFVIRFPITTGAASGTSLSSALYRGICEIIERDAFMINYLNKLPCPKIVYEGKNKIIRRMMNEFDKYNLKLYLFDITTDIKIPSVMAILIDHSKVGPAISIGSKSSLNYEDSIIGSMEEAQQIRPWARELWQKRDEIFNVIRGDWHRIRTLEQRAILWYDIKMIEHIKFWLSSKKEEHINGSEKKLFNTDFLKLNFLLKKLKPQKVFFVDVTTSDIKENGFYVIKAIIPDLQPLYIMEKFRCWGGRRLYEVPRVLGYKKNETSEKKLNEVPHPFL